MRVPCLWVLLLAVAAFSFSTALEPRFQEWEGDRHVSDNILQAALGDGRKLFAKHFYTKADVYFHNGYYPTIYDANEDFKKGCVAGGAHHAEQEEMEDFLGPAKDWIDAFSRHFFPAHHTHLGETTGYGPEHDGDPDPDGDHDHHHGEGKASEQATGPGAAEILPWLRLSAELDPQRVETYVVASYWLRNKLGKLDEAEQFLREGLQANPGDYEILFELGRIYYENREDVAHARNIWELALRRWQEREGGKSDPPLFAYGSILNNLAMLEREQNNYPRAIKYYTALKEISPNPANIQLWIDYLKTNGPPIKVGLSAPAPR